MPHYNMQHYYMRALTMLIVQPGHFAHFLHSELQNGVLMIWFVLAFG